MFLQSEPRNYRHFGIWWWPVKRLVKQHYNIDQLYLLGNYEDAAMVEQLDALRLTPEQILDGAGKEYFHNARLNPYNTHVSNLDNEPYVIWDQDAGL